MAIDRDNDDERRARIERVLEQLGDERARALRVRSQTTQLIDSIVKSRSENKKWKLRKSPAAAKKAQRSAERGKK